ncbi:hypothetical protein [Caballeronia insecticola]|uniref:Uncharacterized protein n=1 Tax=Caballeronia insecticola TaxID=758793 RepID=R4WN48_9BURK|nr:hypothetical protein [Caballeronia insecticola]BAN25969.1 putative uncharacterized protein [Caballeronia insecticola]
MLSPHEISTLLLIQRSPNQVEVFGQLAARLRQEALVEITRLPTGVPMPLLTPKGHDMLERLNALCKPVANETDASE